MSRDGLGRMQFNPAFLGVVEANFSRDVKCIVGCQMGGRSLKAAGLLQDAGFTNVVDMRGGMGGEVDALGQATYAGWALRGYPVATESAPEDRYEALAKNAG